jgi:hypothetical protein
MPSAGIGEDGLVDNYDHGMTLLTDWEERLRADIVHVFAELVSIDIYLHMN